MRELKFRGLVEQTENRKRYWVYYGVGSKPALIGARWLVEDCQYTGLLDKNKTEIYDGDLINIVEDGEPIIQIINWHDGGFFRTDAYGADIHVEGYEAMCHYKVIGNIHENPELLGKEQ